MYGKKTTFINHMTSKYIKGMRQRFLQSKQSIRLVCQVYPLSFSSVCEWEFKMSQLNANQPKLPLKFTLIKFCLVQPERTCSLTMKGYITHTGKLRPSVSLYISIGCNSKRPPRLIVKLVLIDGAINFPIQHEIHIIHDGTRNVTTNHKDGPWANREGKKQQHSFVAVWKTFTFFLDDMKHSAMLHGR